MKNIVKYIIFLGATFMGAITTHAIAKESDKTAYDFSFESLSGDPMPLSAFKGKVLLVVNTASKCGFTPQYDGLEKLYEKHKDKGLVIIGVPSNDFGGQEPGTATEIKEFCKLNYGVTFPMTSKYEVSGDDAHPFYKWIGDVLGFGSGAKWNFHKYLIGRDGKPVDYFGSMTTPGSAKLNDAIELSINK